MIAAKSSLYPPSASGMAGMDSLGGILNSFRNINNMLIPRDGNPNLMGTSIPYVTMINSDIILNPSTVSISEFKKMKDTMPVISTGLIILLNLIKSQIYRFSHKNAKYEDFINEMMETMNRPWLEIIEDMFSATWAGHYVGEKQYDTDGRYIVIKDIAPRPQQSIVYRVDSSGTLKDDGIIQYYYNNSWNGYGNLFAPTFICPNGQQTPNPYASMGDLDYPWRTNVIQPFGAILLPKDKCIQWSFNRCGKLGNLYGESLLRPAYDSYLIRCSMNFITENAAKYKASPNPIFWIDPSHTNISGQTTSDELAEALSRFAEDNYLIINGKRESVEYDSFKTTTNIDELVDYQKYLDSMMLTCVLFPSELAGLSDKGSYALGETQQDLLGRNIDSIVESMNHVLIEQMIKPLLQVNFNEKEDFGEFVGKENVAEDIALNLDVINTCRANGYELKEETFMNMVGLKVSDIEKHTPPIPFNTSTLDQNNNRGLNSNLVTASGVL